jgi:hypothetical protein
MDRRLGGLQSRSGEEGEILERRLLSRPARSQQLYRLLARLISAIVTILKFNRSFRNEQKLYKLAFKHIYFTSVNTVANICN